MPDGYKVELISEVDPSIRTKLAIILKQNMWARGDVEMLGVDVGQYLAEGGSAELLGQLGSSSARIVLEGFPGAEGTGKKVYRKGRFPEGPLKWLATEE
ncbi:hypothetical protein [Inquilinus limosus]|uniref:hypothetical protein n=1 Tax=Inquilinus limosus TaxID=171674 RepID=UPI00119822FE|nr:hypothetical protein [Inquilinus limosus]